MAPQITIQRCSDSPLDCREHGAMSHRTNRRMVVISNEASGMKVPLALRQARLDAHRQCIAWYPIPMAASNHPRYGMMILFRRSVSFTIPGPLLEQNLRGNVEQSNGRRGCPFFPGYNQVKQSRRYGAKRHIDHELPTSWGTRAPFESPIPIHAHGTPKTYPHETPHENALVTVAILSGRKAGTRTGPEKRNGIRTI